MFSNKIRLIKKYGYLECAKKLFEKFYRYLFKSRDYLYCCDIKDFYKWNIENNDSLKNTTIIIIYSEKELHNRYLNEILKNEINREDVIKHIKKYFSKGFVLYLFAYCNQIIGYTWVVFGNSTDKYIPLGKNDVYFVSVFIFENFRGMHLYQFAIYRTIQILSERGVLRIYYAVHEWNKPMIKATSRTCFYSIGIVKKIKICNTEFIKWY
jgi:hypothetical protein